MDHFSSRQRFWRMLAAVVSIGLVSAAVYVCVVFIWVARLGQYPVRDFDQQLWHAEKERRYEISKSIMHSEMLIGKTKADVREILGEEGNSDESDLWIYYLGFKPGLMSIDPDILEITFEAGRVVKVTQRET